MKPKKNKKLPKLSSVGHASRRAGQRAKDAAKATAGAAKKLPKRRKAAEERAREALANVPNITNETIAEHRENVLSGARKFIYPLKHSRRRVVIISTSIFATALVVFLAYVGVSLYRLQSTSTFIYGVTRVLPFPVAKAGDAWISYNSYLFELRHYMHYYETQQDVDFSDPANQQQLDNYKQQALEQVIDDSYVKRLAEENGVKVTGRDVDNQVALVRSQNRLGTSDREFREVLNEFWGWSIADFKHSLRQQMLAQAVAAKLDTDTTSQANEALDKIKAGGDFATIAKEYSDDASTKDNGGQYADTIASNNTDLSPVIMAKLFDMEAGEVSEVINTGYSLEILKVESITDGKVKAAHIQFNIRPISDFVDPLKKQDDIHRFIRLQ